MKQQRPPETYGIIQYQDYLGGTFRIAFFDYDPRGKESNPVRLLKDDDSNIFYIPTRSGNQLWIEVTNNSHFDLLLYVALQQRGQNAFHSIFSPETPLPTFDLVRGIESWEAEKRERVTIRSLMEKRGGRYIHSKPLEIGVVDGDAVIRPDFDRIRFEVGVVISGEYRTEVDFIFHLKTEENAETMYYERCGSHYNKWFSANHFR